MVSDLKVALAALFLARIRHVFPPRHYFYHSQFGLHLERFCV